MEKKIIKISVGELTERIYNAPVGTEINFAATNDMSESWGAQRFNAFNNSFILIGNYNNSNCEIFNEGKNKRKEISWIIRYCLCIDDRDENPIVYTYEPEQTDEQSFFIHAESGCKIYASLDTTILNYNESPFSKITKLLNILKETPDYESFKKSIPEDALISGYHPFWNEEKDMFFFFLLEIDQEIEYYVSEGYFFGSHPGESADCGFWKKELVTK